MAMYKTWEEERAEARAAGRAEGFIEGRAEGFIESRAEGFIETCADSVLVVLHARGIAVPDAVRQRILAQTDLDQLQRWLENAAVASSLADVIGDPI